MPGEAARGGSSAVTASKMSFELALLLLILEDILVECKIGVASTIDVGCEMVCYYEC